MGKWSEKWDYIVSREKAKFTYMGTILIIEETQNIIPY
jgi:hypothetical protein